MECIAKFMWLRWTSRWSIASCSFWTGIEGRRPCAWQEIDYGLDMGGVITVDLENSGSEEFVM